MSKRLTDYEKSTMLNMIHRLLEARKKMHNIQFTGDEELYAFWRELMPEEVIHSIEVLSNNALCPDIVESTRCVNLRTDDYVIKLCTSSSLYWSTPYSGLYVPYNHPMCKGLNAAGKSYLQEKYSTALTKTWVNRIISNSSAAGQIKRAWPELVKYLGSTAVNSIEEATRKSRLPSNINYNEFSTHKPAMERVLAEAHLLNSTDLVDKEVRIIGVEEITATP